MFTGSMLAIIVVVFLIVLLLVAIAGEKFPLTDTKQQIAYSLALGIHCTTKGPQIKAIHTMINTFIHQFPKNKYHSCK